MGAAGRLASVLTTHCPTCSTAFRVTPDQLKARAGKVRCGHCDSVFNALESLEDLSRAQMEAESAAPEPPPAEPPQTPIEAETEPPAVSEPEIQMEAVPEAAAVRRGPKLAWSCRPCRRSPCWFCRLPIYFAPNWRSPSPTCVPLLEEMCACSNATSRCRARPIWSASRLRTCIPTRNRKLLVLAATLKNRAPFAQAYPHLELTLTDTRDQPVLRKVLAPEDYLAQGVDVRAGFAANGDLAVNLWLDAGETGASGYRLYLFYP
jgi:predicted Zn finger-like uncharacterized protein